MSNLIMKLRPISEQYSLWERVDRNQPRRQASNAGRNHWELQRDFSRAACQSGMPASTTNLHGSDNNATDQSPRLFPATWFFHMVIQELYLAKVTSLPTRTNSNQVLWNAMAKFSSCSFSQLFTCQNRPARKGREKHTFAKNSAVDYNVFQKLSDANSEIAHTSMAPVQRSLFQ